MNLLTTVINFLQVGIVLYWILTSNYWKILSEENINRKICSLLKELKERVGVSSEEMDEFKKIMDLADFSEDQE